MNHSKAIDYLLENGRDVIQYRLHKEILKDLSKAEEETLLDKVMQTPNYRLLESYVKPNGYIGIGMHSWEKFKETELQDGESAARLLSNYAIPKDSAIVKNFINALRDDRVLEEEFSYYNPEIARFQNRFLGLNNGGGLMVVLYTCQALLGYGDDDEVRPFVETSFKAFESLLQIKSLEDITIYQPNAKRKYNYPYIEHDVYFPCQYHLETLAYTQSWRNDTAVHKMVEAVNYHDKIMKPDSNIHVKIGSRYYAPLWAYVRPFHAYEANTAGSVAQRKTLTNLARVGGDRIDVVRKSAEVVEEALSKEGYLKIDFESSYQKQRYKAGLKYPGPYSEAALEPDHKTNTALWCELTFWGVQFLDIIQKHSTQNFTAI